MGWFQAAVDIGQLMSGIGALVASIFAAITLLEMKRQRSESYKPDLAFKSKFAYFGFVEDDCARSGMWAASSEYLSAVYSFNHDEVGGIPSYNLNLTNVGNGTSKNIRVDFSLDDDGCIEYINNQFYQ